MASAEVNELFASSRFFQRLYGRRKRQSPSKKTITSPPVEQKDLQQVGNQSQAQGNDSRAETPDEPPTRVCPVCFDEKNSEEFPSGSIMPCPHRACRTCLKHYFTLEIVESRVKLTCPECSETFHPSLIKEILENDTLMEKFEEFTLRKTLMSIPDTRWCPAPDCGYALIASNCSPCPKLQCRNPGCLTEFCYHCKQVWHPNMTCDDARRKRDGDKATNNRGRRRAARQSSSGGGLPTLKACPRCSTKIMKANDGSCNHITCSMCNAEFCWLCLKEISDLHFLSPSGCTFWGRKPWSRKKKILWQLGFLVGAPVGIALVAAITPPAMMLAVPLYYGRKIAKRKFKSNHSRRLATASAVLVAASVSPLLAALSIGIGVPLLLIYVYGVIPFELCRNGGCRAAVSATADGIRLDFDDTPGSRSPSVVEGSSNLQVPATDRVFAESYPSVVPSQQHPSKSARPPASADEVSATVHAMPKACSPVEVV